MYSIPKIIKYIQFSLPYTYPSEIRRLIPRGSKILDIGCGDGYLMSWINFKGDYEVVGMDVNSKDLEIASSKKSLITNTKIYKKLIKGDITKKLPKTKYDIVLSSQLVEHLKKKDAIKFIRKLETIAKKRVIVATINGFFEFNHRTPGKYDIHLSGWSKKEFNDLGYTTYGQGLRIVYKPGLLKDILPSVFSVPLFIVSYMFSPLVRYFPKLSLLLISCKDL